MYIIDILPLPQPLVMDTKSSSNFFSLYFLCYLTLPYPLSKWVTGMKWTANVWKAPMLQPPSKQTKINFFFFFCPMATSVIFKKLSVTLPFGAEALSFNCLKFLQVWFFPASEHPANNFDKCTVLKMHLCCTQTVWLMLLWCVKQLAFMSEK